MNDLKRALTVIFFAICLIGAIIFGVGFYYSNQTYETDGVIVFVIGLVGAILVAKSLPD